MNTVPINIGYANNASNTIQQFTNNRGRSLIQPIRHRGLNRITRRTGPVKQTANISRSRSPSPVRMFEAQTPQAAQPLNSSKSARVSQTFVKGINRSSGSRSLLRRAKGRRKTRKN